MKNNTKFKKGQIPWNLGVPHTDEARRRISVAKLGVKIAKRKFHSLTEEHKKNLSLVRRGKPKSKEWAKKIGDAQRGEKNHMFGKSYKGEASANWKGGLTKLQRLEKLAGRIKPEQCEICGSFGKDFSKGLCFDHCHATNNFRGWICGRCNLALGLVKDNTETLKAMIIYLTKNK